MQKNVMH